MTSSGRTSFIAGASRGIGPAIARRCAAGGANLATAATRFGPKCPVRRR
jgi:NAD(P)-dependent dehydrogenase (short-subunit alcohol dehydrogenase family)